MHSLKFFRSLCALFVILIGVHLTSASPVGTASGFVFARRSGGGRCWPFCNPFNGGLPNAPNRYTFRPPPSTVPARYYDTPDTQVTLRVETETTGAVVVIASVGTRYNLPAHAEVNVRLQVRGGTNIDFNHANLGLGSETAVARIPADQAAGLRTGERSDDGSFGITLLYKLNQDL
ncbi:hypothetical protein FPCIR_11383 [Fusarium pseudocircinatum]|uniref:Uncharacterized protein n=1 Tax=Fusarium pseudocircinatum TaxID=56676 RepID=A0A8H5KRZ9_9HYPO|nr:hypothetical protein FPCIR_11383 [Fusarium pseudocircinatum]